jgi:hypothetical protein
MEAREMGGWIDDLAVKAKEKKAQELTKGEISLHKAKIITTRFPAFWEALLKQVENDCIELRKKLPDDRTYHLRKESTPTGFRLTGEGGPPFRELSVQPNIEGQCIYVLGHTRTVIDVVVVDNDQLSFTWQGKTYAGELDLSRALIEQYISGK